MWCSNMNDEFTFMKRIKSENMMMWSFPDLDDMDAITVDDETLLAEHNHESSEQVESKHDEPCNPMVCEHAILAEQAKAEIEAVKAEYQKKFTLINNLLTKLESPLSVLDNELIELLHYIIKKSVKNIIYKEIKTDAKLVNRIIKEMIELVEAQNGVVNVFLSEADYKRLNNSEATPSVLFKINPKLAEGDVIVKSNMTEVRAVLNDRINQLLGVKYV